MRRRRVSVMTVLTVAVIALGVAGTVASFLVQGQYAEQEHQTAEYRKSVISQVTSQRDKILDEYTTLADDCAKAADCTTTAPSPQVIEETIAGTPGAPGARGASGRGVAAVTCQSSGNWLVVFDDGTFDTSVGDCVGATGAAGTSGSNGANGSNGADGAAGATGPQGPAGADGRGITSTVCGDDGEWAVTYTDGTTQDAGPCRVFGG